MEAASIPERPVEKCTRCADVCAAKELTKLAGAKTTLYNPHLASFKKAYRDTTLGKLSDEHCRTTLPYGVNDLSTEKYFNYDPPSCFIPKFGMMDLQELERSREEEKFDEDVRKTLEDVYQKTQGAFVMPIGRVIQIPTVKKISYLNFRVRLMTPEPSQKWRQFVHEKDLHYPYGGIEFVRNKFGKTLGMAEITKKEGEPVGIPFELQANQRAAELIAPVPHNQKIIKNEEF
ncbi:hypothetical protein GE061_003106 [Apolygus lucorum]|uniref:Uncharacterized protein n=1 Tax=Apolygus lucorum TaxID=248454 RepID=A0A8S9X2L2_APOLU|nr:hypothetical protein GE061_003106 [Apolygus lucorum]